MRVPRWQQARLDQDWRMTRETTSSNTRFVVWMALAAIVIVADQATKWAIVEWVDLYDRVPINSFINITHQQNTGAAFSFLAGAGGWQRWFFVVLATIVSAVIAVWLWRIRKESGRPGPADAGTRRCRGRRLSPRRRQPSPTTPSPLRRHSEPVPHSSGYRRWR